LLAALARLLPRDRRGSVFVRPETIRRWHRTLVSRRWTQQDSAGIDLERLGDPAEQLIENVVEQKRGNSDLGVRRRDPSPASATQLVKYDVAHIREPPHKSPQVFGLES
jgi:hypothetical protein